VVRESQESSRAEVYEGEWAHGVKHGEGEYTGPNGAVYRGG
jgi:hypothetical protein